MHRSVPTHRATVIVYSQYANKNPLSHVCGPRPRIPKDEGVHQEYSDLFASIQEGSGRFYCRLATFDKRVNSNIDMFTGVSVPITLARVIVLVGRVHDDHGRDHILFREGYDYNDLSAVDMEDLSHKPFTAPNLYFHSPAIDTPSLYPNGPTYAARTYLSKSLYVLINVSILLCCFSYFIAIYCLLCCICR